MTEYYPRFPQPFVCGIMDFCSQIGPYGRRDRQWFPSVLALLSVDKRESNSRTFFISQYAKFVTGKSGFCRSLIPYVTARYKNCLIDDLTARKWQYVVRHFERTYAVYAEISTPITQMRVGRVALCAHEIDQHTSAALWVMESHYEDDYGFTALETFCVFDTRSLAIDEAIRYLWHDNYGAFRDTAYICGEIVRELAKENNAEAQRCEMIQRLRRMVQCKRCYNDLDSAIRDDVAKVFAGPLVVASQKRTYNDAFKTVKDVHDTLIRTTYVPTEEESESGEQIDE